MNRLIFFFLFLVCKSFYGQETMVKYKFTIDKDTVVYNLYIKKDKTVFLREFLNVFYKEKSSKDCADFTITNNMSNSYIITDKIENLYIQTAIPKDMIWKILPDTKVEAGLNLQKAETAIAGAKWEVWFAKNYPVVSGPFIFSGLPGLILEGQCEAEKISFVSTEINKKSLQSTCKRTDEKTIQLTKYISSFTNRNEQKDKLNDQLAKLIGFSSKDVNKFDPNYDPLRNLLLKTFSEK